MEPGVLTFLASVLLLGLLALPYASRNQSSSFDRAIVFAALVFVGTAGLSFDIVTSLGAERLSGPDRAPGLWLAVIGMALATWGTAELAAERPSSL